MDNARNEYKQLHKRKFSKGDGDKTELKIATTTVATISRDATENKEVMAKVAHAMMVVVVVAVA